VRNVRLSVSRSKKKEGERKKRTEFFFLFCDWRC